MLQAAQKTRTRGGKVAPPSDDKRWRLVEATMRKQGGDSSALIETLHTVQDSFGYLDDSALQFVAASLQIPLSMVYGVATFYNYFTLKPQGKHACIVCMGTACYIKGSAAILAELEEIAGIKNGETTPDKKVSIGVARCFGSCGMAPAVVFDGDVAGKLTAAEATDRVKEWLNDAES